MVALLKCYHCQKPVSRYAKACPHCGGVITNLQNGWMHGQGWVDASGKAVEPPKGCAVMIAYMGVGGALLYFCNKLFAAVPPF